MSEPSEPVELGFRQRLAATFAAELDGRIYENAAPPDAKTPYAVYRRVAPGVRHTRNRLTARITLGLYGESYADVKRLQAAVEKGMGDFRRGWLSAVEAVECPVWVYFIKPYTMPDLYQATTKRRIAVSDFEITYRI